MTSKSGESTDASALQAAAPPTDDIVAVSARARIASSLFPSAAADAAASTPLVGDRYEVTRKIGSGGMGVVYEAFDPQLQRKVAVKVLHPEVAVDDRARKRMLREARALARLAHPNVIAVHDVGEADDQVFVAMELVQGSTLRTWVEEHAGDWQAVLERYIQAGRGLASAHHAGLVHRDFKPDNVLVGDDGRVRVLDFGLARRTQELTEERALGELDIDADADPDAPTERGVKPVSAASAEALLTDGQLTDFGAVVGTPRYMAPEQFDAGIVDAASDQFSFCVSLYEALYRQRAYAATNVPTLAAKVVAGEFESAPRDGDIPAFIADALERGLSPRKEARWPDMDALLEILEQAVERPGAPSVTGAEIPLPVTPPTPARPAWIAWGVAAVALAVAASVWLARRPNDADQASDEGQIAALRTPEDARAELAATGGAAGAGTGSDGGGLVAPSGIGTVTDAQGVDAGTDGGTDGASGGEVEPETSPVRKPPTDFCHMDEDKYVLLSRGKRRTRLSTADGDFRCRRETSRSRIQRFNPSDCEAYMVCGPVSSL